MRGSNSRTVIGLVLAAGAGRRLWPLTRDLPKALVPLDDRSCVLDITLANFATVGLTEAAVVVGYRGEAIVERVPDLQAATGLRIEVVWNAHADDRNNAYSLWCARDVLVEGALVANGDTLHPSSVDRRLLEDVHGDALILAVDSSRPLGDEEMKVRCLGGRVQAIAKTLPHDVDGEFIGVSAIPGALGERVVSALARTWKADPNHYYEDAYQLLADEGLTLQVSDIGPVDWTEIDDLQDLERARELVCRF